MAETSAIEWTDSTFNPWIGCTKISPACDHCYAEALMDKRHGRVQWGGERSRTSASNWQQPRRWQKQAAAFFAEHGRRRRVFCSSLADVFDNQVPPEWRDDLWALIRETPDLDWLLLTKRPQNIGKMLPNYWAQVKGHVWLGTTVEDQKRADLNIPHLLEHDAAVLFVSCEPLLGPINLAKFMWPVHARWPGRYKSPAAAIADGAEVTYRRQALVWAGRNFITWAIAGGESGPQARPCHPDWFRDLRDQCARAEVPFLFKQWGEWATAKGQPGNLEIGHVFDDGYQMIRLGKKRAGRLLDGVEHNGFPVSP